MGLYREKICACFRNSFSSSNSFCGIEGAIRHSIAILFHPLIAVIATVRKASSLSANSLVALLYASSGTCRGYMRHHLGPRQGSPLACAEHSGVPPHRNQIQPWL
jgi:hypothetical protein